MKFENRGIGAGFGSGLLGYGTPMNQRVVRVVIWAIVIGMIVSVGIAAIGNFQ